MKIRTNEELRGQYGSHEIFFAVVQDGFDRNQRPSNCFRTQLNLLDPSGVQIDVKLNVKILERRTSPTIFGLFDLDNEEIFDGGIDERHTAKKGVRLWIGIPESQHRILLNDHR